MNNLILRYFSSLRSSRQLTLPLLIIFSAGTQIGCGVPMSSDLTTNHASAYPTSHYPNSNSSSTNGFRCSGIDDILPVGAPPSIDRIDSFSICTSKTPGNYNELLVHGNTLDNTLCVFPIQENGSSAISSFQDSAGNLVYQCSEQENEGTYFNFTQLQKQNKNRGFNAVFITSAAGKDHMISCLLSSFMSSNCDLNQFPYAYGRFR